jgi:hypothetical protein
MGTGYTRNDTSNNIANGNVIDADDLDGEFNAIDAAFDESTGHTHDGTSAEGAPITVTGPGQEYLSDATALYPKTDDTYDLGKTGAEWKDLYIDGTANLDTAEIGAGNAVLTNLTASGTINFSGATISDAGSVTTIDINGGTINGITDLAVADGGTGASTAGDARTNLGIVIGSDVQAHDAGLDDIAALAVTDGNFIVGDGANWVVESGATARTSLGLGSIATQDASSVTISGGSVTGITDLAVADGGTGASTEAGARTNLGLGSMATQNSGSVTITGGAISGITDLAVADGGTGASTAADARTNLGLAIGTDVQAYDAGLTSIAGLTTVAGDVVYTTASDTYAALNIGTAGQVLTVNSGATAPEWATLESPVKAWVSFNGTGTVAIRDSGNATLNVSSITDNGTGSYTVNFTSAFSNADYAVLGASGNSTAACRTIIRGQAVGSVNVSFSNIGTYALTDVDHAYIAILAP